VPNQLLATNDKADNDEPLIEGILGQIYQRDDGNTQGRSAEPWSPALPRPLDKVSGEESEGNISELEGDMLLPSSQRPQGHDQGGTDYGRSEKSNSSYAANSDNDDDFSNGQSRDNDERLRLAKRCQLSSPQDGPTLKRQCKGYPQLLHNGLSRRLRNLTRSRAASAPAQLKGSASFQYDSQPTRRSSPPSPMIDKASCNARAAYQEWPVYGFFKLVTIGNEVRYGMEFSLEDVEQLCATTLPLHTSSTGSSTSFSALPSRRAQAKNALSQSKRPRFTQEEDAKLLVLREGEGRSWGDIQRSFPGRSAASLQVRYSTKLKDRSNASQER